MKIISTSSAQIVMIGIENEQISPRSKLSAVRELPFIASLRLVTRFIWRAQLVGDAGS